MDELNLRIIITSDPGNLEQFLHSTEGSGLLIKSFVAEHNPLRNHYEVTLCLTGFSNPHALVCKLVQLEHIRELTPLKPIRAA